LMFVSMEITQESIRDQIPYYLSQSAKENLAKALDRFPRQIDYYIDRYKNEHLQGDGWTTVDVFNFEDGTRKTIKALLLSNSCDIDPENKRDLPVKLSFASMVKLRRYIDLLVKSGFEQKKIDAKIMAIKEQRVTSLLYLPKGADLEEDYIALLDDVHTVPYQAFNLREEKKKLFTLSNVGFYLFVLKLSVHFCRLHEEIDREPISMQCH
jgi:hypothetical protein